MRRVSLGVASMVGPMAAFGYVLAAVVDAHAGLAVAFVCGLAAIVIDVLLLIWLVPHAIDNPRLDGTMSVLWILVLCLPGVFVAPFYWLRHVLPRDDGWLTGSAALADSRSAS
jgi:hypothetical protein